MNFAMSSLEGNMVRSTERGKLGVKCQMGGRQIGKCRDIISLLPRCVSALDYYPSITKPELGA